MRFKTFRASRISRNFPKVQDTQPNVRTDLINSQKDNDVKGMTSWKIEAYWEDEKIGRWEGKWVDADKCLDSDVDVDVDTGASAGAGTDAKPHKNIETKSEL